jgi:flavin-dependent dehydrogenase
VAEDVASEESPVDLQSDGFDVAVIGAGPAGALAATLVRQRGLRVCVLERARFPRFVIGESLLPSCMNHLDAAGLLPDLERQGYLEKGGVAILEGDQRAEFDFADQFHAGWTYTWQVKRAEFDQALAEAAARRGVEILFEREVTAFEPGPTPTLTWRSVAPGADGRSHSARFRFVIDASGYGRVLTRLLGLERPSTLPSRRAVFAHVRGDHRPEGRRGGFSWAVCHEDRWIWVIPFADGATSVGFVALPEAFEGAHGPVPGAPPGSGGIGGAEPRPRRAPHGPPGKIARLPRDPAAALRHVIAAEPTMARRFPEPEFVFEPRTLENYSASITSLHGDGFCLVGNAGEFLDPIFSSGISFAFASGRMAADLVARQLGGEAIDWHAEYAAPLLSGIDVFRDYVHWWYEGAIQPLFFSEAPPTIRRQMCSVLAGYVWDAGNPFVADRKRKVPQLLRVLAGQRGA